MKWLELQRDHFNKTSVANLHAKDYSIDEIKTLFRTIKGQYMGLVEKVVARKSKENTIFLGVPLWDDDDITEVELTLTWFRLSDIGRKYEYSKYFRPEHDTIPKLIEL